MRYPEHECSYYTSFEACNLDAQGPDRPHCAPWITDKQQVLGPTSKSRWSYACSKAIDEFMAIAYWREKKTPAVVARLFNTNCLRQSGQYGMVAPRFISQAMDGSDVTVYRTGGAPDIRKIVKLTGCRPRIEVDEALRQTIDWFREKRVEEQQRELKLKPVE